MGERKTEREREREIERESEGLPIYPEIAIRRA